MSDTNWNALFSEAIAQRNDARAELAAMTAELATIRDALAGIDVESLPRDLSIAGMAANIRDERNKFLWQVRDTCARAEKAEAERDEARAELARLTTLRPASEHDDKSWVVWYDNIDGDNKWKPILIAACNIMDCERFAPLPDAKEKP